MDYCAMPHIYQTLRKHVDPDAMLRILDDLMAGPEQVEFKVELVNAPVPASPDAPDVPPVAAPAAPAVPEVPAAKKTAAKRAPKSEPAETPAPETPKEKLFFTPEERAAKDAAAETPPPPPPAEEVTLEDVKSVVNAFVDTMDRTVAAKRIGALLKSYEATNLSSLNPAHYASVIADLQNEMA